MRIKRSIAKAERYRRQSAEYANNNVGQFAPSMTGRIHIHKKRSRTRAELVAEQLLHEVCGPHRIEFKAEVQIGRSIVDFYVFSRHVAIEIDGGYHLYRKAEDEVRTAELNRRGITVYRFTNDEVLKDTESVRAKLKAIIR